MQHLDTATITIDITSDVLDANPAGMIEAAKDRAIALSGLTDRREPVPRRFGPHRSPEMGGWVKAAVVRHEFLPKSLTVRYTICVEGWRETS